MGNAVRDGNTDPPITLDTFDQLLEYWGGLCMRIQVAAEKWWVAKARRDRSAMADWYPLVSYALDTVYAFTSGLAAEGRKVGEDTSAFVDFMQLIQEAHLAWRRGAATPIKVGKEKLLLDPIAILVARQCAMRIRAQLAIQAPRGALIHVGPLSPKQREGAKARREPVAKDNNEFLVKLQGPTRRPLVNGKEKSLNAAQYAVVEALVQARPNGLTKDSLEKIRTDARGILRRLRRDADWRGVIHMAEVTSGRYRID